MRISMLIATAFAGAALLSAGAAGAHAQLTAASPAANATVTAPKALTLTFSERLAPAFSGLALATAQGAKVMLKTSLSADHKTLTGAPDAALKAGLYIVTWHATAADDGHRRDGTVAFTVR